MTKKDLHLLGHTLLRVTIGLMFIITGIKKLGNISGVDTMLGNLGFPIATFFAWLLALSEFIFGALIFLGFKTRITALPLAFILLVAEILVVIPNQGILSTNSFFHLIAISGIVTIYLTGPGKFSLTKR
ncbi:MAG: membrane protein [Candidatus Pacearchaeota archaeon]|nr:MAG: membrane protein [Candidatus Pacearchaeota archaeon]